MKRVLIAGQNSYVGQALAIFLMKEPEQYEVFELDVKSADWKQHDIASYDVVF